jgi:dihydroneopterin aldolase
MLANLTLKGIHFHAFHGALEVERELGQVLELDIQLGYEVEPGEILKGRTPNMAYGPIYEEVQKVVMGTKHTAIEGLALDIARHLFATFPILQMGTVIVRRRQLFIPGDVASAEVELTVDREDLEGI